MSTTRRASDLIYAVHAKHTGELLAHCITRRAFDRCVLNDGRTRDLFERWGEGTGLDALVDELGGLLDVFAARAGLTTRVELSTNRALVQQVAAPNEADRAMRLEQRIDQLLADTQPTRLLDLASFVSTTLYEHAPPFVGWLCADLISVFALEVKAHIWSTVFKITVPLPPTLGPVRRGNRPKGDGAHLMRNADWYYLAKVADPKVPQADLARAYANAKSDEGVALAPRDLAGVAHRPDTKSVRVGIEDAERLLSLTIPPWQWTEYVESGPDRGGKTLH